jgi:hypothetical protein
LTQSRRGVRNFAQPVGGSARPVKQGSAPVLPLESKDWPLATLKEKLIKVGAKAISHDR